MEKRSVYLDNAATTTVSGEVLNAMMPYFTSIYGNSNSLHSFGREAVAGVDNARDIICKAINAEKNEVFFTSGGTEANNWAVIGTALANRKRGMHIITSQIEHHSVIDACKRLEQEGFEVSYLPVDENGLVSITDLLHEIKSNTVLVSIMAVNNEVGTIQNLRTIGEIVKFYKAYFHVDAVQALGVMDIDVQTMNIDMLSMSAHKIHGPKGMGALYIRKGTIIDKFMLGGEQELNKRGGTVNVPAAVGFGKAVEIAKKNMQQNNKKLADLADYFIKQVEYFISDIKINANISQKNPGIVNISFDRVDGESLLMLLDMEGIAVSTGSACASGSLLRSHVLAAMGLEKSEINGAIRFSFGTDLTNADIDYTVSVLTKLVERLRKINPEIKKGKKNV
ncbi:MAG: cysteine desulfurase [Clostridia bacterium]|nr:cysteine desulfurase [Clostridia bacterium]